MCKYYYTCMILYWVFDIFDIMYNSRWCTDAFVVALSLSPSLAMYRHTKRIKCIRHIP